MNQNRILAIYAVFIAALFTAACKWEPTPVDSDVFHNKLRGTWESNDPSVYSGKLVIEYNRITISDYLEIQTPLGGDDNRRPFKGFTRGVPLKGYSEEGDITQENIIQGFIYIQDGGSLQSPIPYTFWEDPYQYGYTQRQFLRFNFGDRPETLIKEEQ